MLFFDLDDTLVDDSGAAAAAVRALYVAYRDRIQDSLEAFTSRWRLAGRVAFTGYYDANLRLFPDVKPLLKALGDRPLGIITNGAPERQQAKLVRVGLQGRFDPVVTAGEVSIRKPEARLFHVACARAGVAPAETVHVGNNLAHDAEAARAAGLRGVWLNRNGATSDPPFAPQIRDLRELTRLL